MEGDELPIVRPRAKPRVRAQTLGQFAGEWRARLVGQCRSPSWGFVLAAAVLVAGLVLGTWAIVSRMQTGPRPMLASEVAADAPIVEERIWWEIVLAPGDQALVKRNLSGQLYLLAGSGSFIERVSEDGVEFQGGPTLEMQHVWALHLTGKERVERVMDRIQRAKLPEARGVLARLTPGTRFHAPYPQLKRSTDPEFPFVATIETKESEAVTAQHFQVLAHCRQFVAAYPVRPVRPEMPALVDQLRIFPAQSIAAVYGEAPVELKEAEKRNP